MIQDIAKIDADIPIVNILRVNFECAFCNWMNSFLPDLKSNMPHNSKLTIGPDQNVLVINLNFSYFASSLAIGGDIE